MSDSSARMRSADEASAEQMNAALLAPALLPSQEFGAPGPLFANVADLVAEHQDPDSTALPDGVFGTMSPAENTDLNAPRIGGQNDDQNNVTIDTSTIGSVAAIGKGDGGVSSVSPPQSVGDLSTNLPAGTGSDPNVPLIANYIAAEGRDYPNETLALNVSDSGSMNGNSNAVVIGRDNSGSGNGNFNQVAIGNNNGVIISVTPGSDLVPGGATFETAGNGATASPMAAQSLGDILASSGLMPMLASPQSDSPQSSSVPSLNVIFESIQITVTDTGNNDGNGNTVTLGNNSGSSNGNNNSVAIGNDNGVDISALNPAGTQLLTDDVQMNVVGSADGNGDGNQVGIASWDSTNGNGNGNQVLIGNGNGIGLSIDGTSDQASSSLSSGAQGLSTTTDANLGTYVLAGNATPFDVSSETASLAVSDMYDNMDGSGNNNLVEIGNSNGANININLGNLFPASGSDIVAESVLINALQSGNNDGTDNAVLIGSGNGPGSAGMVSPSFLSPNAAAAPDAASGTAFAGLPSWADVNVDSIINDVAQMLPASGGPTNLIFEAVGINVVNSGNNDGTQNALLVGSENAGSFNGNNNLVAIGNDNGLLIHV